MKCILYFSLIFLFSFQSLNSQIKYHTQQKLSELLSQKINTLRQEKSKQPLKRHEDLAKAAKLHSKYMVRRNSLNHVQVNTEFPTPKDRVIHFNKGFTNVGENILYTGPKKLPLSNSDIKKLADEMFLSWRNSPGHYANMISDNFKYADFGFTYNSRTKRVFATHVFAKKAYVIGGQISDNAFSIKSSNSSCDGLIGNKGNVIVNVGNAITITNNEVILGYHNLKMIQEILENKNDGIAIDLIERDQLVCGKDNRLDASDIYEGVLLKPVYRDELFSNNKAKSPNRLVVSLGKIPIHLRDKELSPNVILIKDGMKCSYNVPSQIPSRRYDLKVIAPEIYSPDISMKTKGINGLYEVSFDFRSGEIVPVNKPSIQIDETAIHSIEIKSYTSVDGNSNANEKLHSERALYIKTFLKQGLNIETKPIKIDAKENWELCYYHLELLGLEETLGRDKKKIKQYLVNNRDQNWKDALELQRRSKAIIYTKGEWKKEDINFLNYNLTDAMLNENYELANRVLAEMYLVENSNLFLNEEFVIDKLFDKRELVQNVSALLLKNVDFYALDNIVFFVRSWLSKPELLSEPAQKNLLNLYTITSRRLLRNWDSSAKNLSKVMHPEKVEPLFESYKNQNKVNPLFLNYHMASIEYFGQINYSPKISESFDFITDYFRSQSKSIDDDTDLSLFFNSWSMYHMTIEKLYGRYEYDELDEESSFVLVKTYVPNSEEDQSNILLDLHKIAIGFNQERWCRWIYKDFQNLRNEGVKNLFCNTCSL